MEATTEANPGLAKNTTATVKVNVTALGEGNGPKANKFLF